MVTSEQFIDRLKVLAKEDATIYTLARSLPFKIRHNGKRWIFVPESTKGERRVEPPILQRVIETFNKTGSLRPCDYHETTNGSYYCAVLADMG